MAVNLPQDVASPATQDAASLRSVFEAIAPETCPRSFNFHMHTVCSDGRLQPEQLMEQAKALGLQGLAITDHHSIRGYRRAQQWLDSNCSNLKLWIGLEVNANLLGEEVHILAYAFDPQHPSIQPYIQSRTATGDLYQAAQVIAAIHAAGGLAILAHPARYRRSPAELIPAAAEFGIDGIETYYAYGNPSPWQPSARQTQEVKAIGAVHGLLNTCGTDTHGLSLLQRL